MGCGCAKIKISSTKNSEQTKGTVLSQIQVNERSVESGGAINDRFKFQDQQATVSETRSSPFILNQQKPVTLCVSSGITVHVTPAALDEFINDGKDRKNCLTHNKPFDRWCKTCQQPLCLNCRSVSHPESTGHVIQQLDDVHAEMLDDLHLHEERLSSMLAELHPLQEEVSNWKQRDQEFAEELLETKKRSCDDVEDIKQQIALAESILLQWQQADDWPKLSTANVYRATQSIKSCVSTLNSISEQLKNGSEIYKLKPSHSIFYDEEFESPMDLLTVPTNSQLIESEAFKRMQTFMLNEVFRSHYPFLKGKSDGSLKIIISFDNGSNYNSDVKKYRDNTRAQTRELLKLRLRKYLNQVTQCNARYKALQLFHLFHIRISNVNVITDAAMDVAMSSDHHCIAMVHFLAFLIGASAKTIEWHFAADNMPSYLMERCQEELHKDVYSMQRRLENENSLPSNSFRYVENHPIWKQYKRLVRFIGELYVSGLIPAALMEYFLDHLMAKEDDSYHYRECICILLLAIGPTTEIRERQVSVDNYIQQLEEKQKLKPNMYIQHLIQHIEEMRQNRWNLKDCSGVSTVNNQQTDIILEYLNSIEMAALADASRRRTVYKSGTDSSSEKDDLAALLDAYGE